MPKRKSSFKKWQLNKLADPRRAASYLQTALDESPEQFLIALGKVAQARQMTRVASEAGLQRESLYRSLSGQGNPTLATLTSVLSAVGLRLNIGQVSSEQTAASHSVEVKPVNSETPLYDCFNRKTPEHVKFQNYVWKYDVYETGQTPACSATDSVDVVTQTIGPLRLQVPQLNQSLLMIEAPRTGGKYGLN